MKTEIKTLNASWRPVNRTIPLNVCKDVNTRVFTNPTNIIVLAMTVHSRFWITRLFRSKRAKNIAAKLQPMSSRKINHRGTMFIFLRNENVFLYVIESLVSVLKFSFYPFLKQQVHNKKNSCQKSSNKE